MECWCRRTINTCRQKLATMSFCIYIQDDIDNILYKCKSKIHVEMISNVCNLLPCPKIDTIFTNIIIVILSAISFESK